MSGGEEYKNIDELFASMFSEVEARPQPPAEIEQAVFVQILRQWEMQRANKKRKKVIYLSMAAAVLMALLIQPLFFSSSELPNHPVTLGTVLKFTGEVSVFTEDQHFKLSSQAQPFPLSQGLSLATAAEAGFSIKWGEGYKKIRVDQETELNLLSDNKIQLLFGRLYVDVPPRSSTSSQANGLQIVTRFGTVRHIGTQFIVAINDSQVEIKVREGSVSIEDRRQSYTTRSGEKGTLDASGDFSTESIQTYGPSWNWVEEFVPAFDIEGRTLSDFLAWIHRETGKKLYFESIAAETLARDTILHGASIEMKPMLALDLVLQTSELSWNEQAGTIHLFLEP